MRRAVTLAEAHEQDGDLTEASTWLTTACDVIETLHYERLRPKAAMPDRRLSAWRRHGVRREANRGTEGGAERKNDSTAGCTLRLAVLPLSP